MDSINIPESCDDAQIARIITAFQQSKVLPENLKAYYVEQLQKKYANILLKRTIIASMSAKAAAVDALGDDDDVTIILHDKGRRTNE